jgi:hypothetical protein
MLHHIIFKKIAAFRVVYLLMIVPVTALADSDLTHLSWQVAQSGGNPWAVPGTYQYQGKHRQHKFQNQLDQEWSGHAPGTARSYQKNRFVTPEFLESLRRQQSKYQVMPENRHYQQQSSPASKGGMPEVNLFNYPGYGLEYIDPLSNTPVITPWGVDVDGIDNE